MWQGCVRHKRNGEMRVSRREFLSGAAAFVSIGACPVFAALMGRSHTASTDKGLHSASFRSMLKNEERKREPIQFRVVQWNIGHFAHGKDKRTAIVAKESKARSAEYRAMIDRLKPDFLGVSEFDPVFDKAGQPTTKKVFASFPTKIVGPKAHYQCNALFTHFKCVRHEVVDYVERCQKTYFIDAVFKFGPNEVHFVQSHLDWARLPDQDSRPPDDKRFAQRQIKQLVEHFRDKPYVIVSADFNVSQLWHFKEFTKAGYTVANQGRYDLLDNIVSKGFDVKELFSADDEKHLSDHRIVGCVLEIKNEFMV